VTTAAGAVTAVGAAAITAAGNGGCRAGDGLSNRLARR
jgi:hypothetical protein